MERVKKLWNGLRLTSQNTIIQGNVLIAENSAHDSSPCCSEPALERAQMNRNAALLIPRIEVASQTHLSDRPVNTAPPMAGVFISRNGFLRSNTLVTTTRIHTWFLLRSKMAIVGANPFNAIGYYKYYCQHCQCYLRYIECSNRNP